MWELDYNLTYFAVWMSCGEVCKG